MALKPLDINSRLTALNAVMSTKTDKEAVKKAFKKHNGDLSAMLESLKGGLSEGIPEKLKLADSLAAFSDGHAPVVKALADQPNVKSLRDVALHFDAAALAGILDAKAVPASMSGSPEEKKRKYAASLYNKLFAEETSAVLQRMTLTAEIPIVEAGVREGVVNFLNNQPEFNIRTKSVYIAIKEKDAFKGIADEQRPGVIEHLKILQRVQAISPTPETVPVLMKANLTSSLQITAMPESAFLKRFAASLGEENAKLAYTNATNLHIRNENALITMREAVRGTGLAIIDGQTKTAEYTAEMKKLVYEKVPLNLDSLFGDMDYCECDHCTSVYSAAAYFVDLLQFLRNNNLDPDNPNTNQKGIAGTPLEKLFRRRPDLGCLELTCENTDTVLPYVDLVNEVMESFVVHLDEYKADTNNPKQAKLEVFNVVDETSSELLAQPQHTNYNAYCILKSAVYPFTLPYHQPIDATRIFLKYLETSRYELLDRFRAAAEKPELAALHKETLDRTVDAEFLGLTQEEYIILTKQAFWPKAYFDFGASQPYTESEYQQKIGVKDVYAYYGYDTELHMLDTDETQKLGLTFVKKQFLPRTGIQYTDLVELLKTRWINPNYPQGKSLNILESIRFSYRFLQSLVDTTSKEPKVRFAKLIEFLESSQFIIPLFEARFHPDPCQEQKPDFQIDAQDLRHWVYCNFEQIGKLIVLESGEGPHLPISGQLFVENAPPKLIGTLYQDGRILDQNSAMIGNVNMLGQVVGIDGKPFIDKFHPSGLFIQDTNGNRIGYIDSKGIRGPKEERINWLPAQPDTCDLDKVRLMHLDGTYLTSGEYDCIQRFIRLWHKTGWTIDETDKALTGLAMVSPSTDDRLGASLTRVDLADFDDDCADPETGDDCGCSDPDKAAPAQCEITPEFLHQLVAVKKLLDLTGLPLLKLLTFWADISTAGEKSLYARLFLTHNLLGIDKVFKADANGNYLTQSAKSLDHLPILMAALNLKADDVAAIIESHHLDELTLANVSKLYRHGLLAKALHIKVADLPDVIKLFVDPLKNAAQTLELFETWGKMEDAGFTFAQLNYLIQDNDDELRPIAPSKKSILQVAKTLYDGLNAIDRDHENIPDDKPEEATSDLVRAKAALVFDQSVVEQILGLLEGTTVYPPTNVPANLNIIIPDDLGRKLKYMKDGDAKLQLTGILTEPEKINAKALSNRSEWSDAIERLGKKPTRFYNDVLQGIFQSAPDHPGILLAGDIAVPADQLDPNFSDPNTALKKRSYFLKYFLPFLRQQLAKRFIVNTMSGAVGLPGEVTETLLAEIIKVGDPAQLAMAALEMIKNQPANIGDTWKGYLIPSVDGAYSFTATVNTGDPQPRDLVLDGQHIVLGIPQEDPSNVWSTDPTHTTPLKAGKVYKFEMGSQYLKPLQWKTAISPNSAIPPSVLLPDYLSENLKDIFSHLRKAALLVNGFGLNSDEISYWQTHATDFTDDNEPTFNFNAITLQHWKRLQAYTNLRGNLPKTEATLLDLFKWATQPDSAKLNEKIAAVTHWKKENIEKLLTATHFDLNKPEAFRNEVNLIKLRKALQVADKIGVDIDHLFEWAKPGSNFRECHQVAEDIRKAIRARFDQEDWEQVVKPLNDQLRKNQKQALISYLLVQPALIAWPVVDADSLFEFFLIDVQMDPCMETSRIKQAISSVQLFIQRCLFGLEEKYGVPNGVLDRDRWDWMQRYRVWEANRKVFLYPENWIQPNLRDDKSPFFKELESELLQKDINKQTVEDALKSYLFKVDEVANLQVVGLFWDELGNKLHVFARTWNAPYFFYYRYFQTNEKNWYPWGKVQVDIPSYDMEDADGKITGNGCYLTPVVWNERLLVFFPQFMKKTKPAQITIAKKGNRPDNGEPIYLSDLPPTTKELAEVPGEFSSKISEFLEIKLAWSEYRNGKWVQKQLSKDIIYDSDVKTPTPKENEEKTIRITLKYSELPPIDSYQFVPRLYNSPQKVVIDIYRAGNAKGSFSFVGSQAYKENIGASTQPADSSTIFHSKSKIMHSFQAVGGGAPTYETSAPSFDLAVIADEKITNIDEPALPFHHSFAHELLGRLTAGNLDDFFAYYRSFDTKTQAEKDNAFGADLKAKYHELKRSYSLYNWEAAFHAPMQLVDRLLKSQQFEQAIKMCHYVFNPLVEGPDEKRCWQFPPFKEIDAKNVLEKLFSSLQPGQPDDQINEWRDKPFQPHVIARSRPSAYMKWVVAKYIEILVAWGDYLFRQDTIESINQATQLYVLAAHIYGPRGQKIPKRGKVQPQTYNSLLDKWDAFSNAMSELELALPFSNQTPFPIGIGNGVVGLANVFGFATTLYFCIPDNPQLQALRDTIDDRLFKIRHCENIEGVFRKLPLFEPPIDPSLLVQAAAQGLSLSSVLNDLNSPMPNYRFYYLLQKALELCSELKALGNTFLSLKEKGDGEALSQMRARHESSIHNLVMEVKKQQLEEASKSLEALKQSRKGPEYRLQHFLKLIGEDLAKVPTDNTDFSELPNQIEQPVDESGLKLIQYEKEDMDKAHEAADWQIGIGVVETLAGLLNIIPVFAADVKPFGIGAGGSFGGSNLGSAASAIARGMQTYSNNLSFQSSSAGKKGSFLRQLQDRVQQANVAGYEIKNIDKQVLTQQIRIGIANLEITNQQKQIDNAQEVEEFLRNKYTNQELYVWMEGQIRTLYYQAYTLAYELAKKAEKVFRFERGLTTSNFIQFGYWNAAYDGLLSGENLYIALKQLEAVYQEKRGYDYEISKPISLRQIDPMALMQLRETGSCEINLPEVLFDMDHPGHYMRRIKSVALTVPCVVGPYTSLNCTLRLLEHKFRLSAIANNGKDYIEKTEETDERFSTTNIPITSIAVSTGQNDSGVFELNFRDERYIPFEGAGVVSKWRIELPSQFKQFDYDTISDVILHMRYTSVNGGDKLKKSAGESVQDYIKAVIELSRQDGLFAAFDLAHDFPSEWYQAMHSADGATERILVLNNLNDRLPIFVKGRTIQATDIYLFTPASLSMSIVQGDNDEGFTGGSDVGKLKSYSVKNEFPVANWQLKIKDTATAIEKLWLVIRYKLT